MPSPPVSSTWAPTQRFEYSGRVYVRPVYRGICLLDPPIGAADMQTQLDEQVSEGHYQVEIRFVRVPDPDDPADLT